MIKAAIFVSKDVQYEEFIYPYEKFKEAGFDVEVILAPIRKYPNPTAKNGTPLIWDKTAKEVIESGKLLYDVVFIPGGWAGEPLRLSPEVLAIVRYNIDKNNIVCSICHGTEVLLSAQNIPKYTKLTSYIGMKNDVQNAGYIYPYEDIVIDRNIITCSHYKHNEEFIKTIFGILNGKFGLRLPAPIILLDKYHYEFDYNDK